MPSDALIQAALRRNGGGAPSSNLGGAAVQRIAGDDPKASTSLWEALARWFAGSKDDSEEEQLRRQQAVDRAALESMPDATGIPETLDAVDRRKRLYQDIEDATR